MHPAGPTVGNTASVMAMLSFGGVMNISLTADKGVIKRPDELVKNIHRLVNEDS